MPPRNPIKSTGMPWYKPPNGEKEKHCLDAARRSAAPKKTEREGECTRRKRMIERTWRFSTPDARGGRARSRQLSGRLGGRRERPKEDGGGSRGVSDGVEVDQGWEALPPGIQWNAGLAWL